MSAAPTFSSFPDLDPNPSQSKTKDKPKEKAKKRHRSRSRSRDRERHKDKDREGKGDKEGKKKKDRDRHRDDKRDKVYEEAYDIRKDERDAGLRYFYSDRRGDPLNIAYGRIHSGDIPKYNIYHRGRQILGLDSAWIAHRTGHGVEVFLRGPRKVPALTDARTRALLAQTPTQHITANPNKYPEVDGVIIVPKRHRAAAEPEDSYRAITAADRARDDSDLSSEEEDEASEEEEDDGRPTLSYHQEKLAQLNRQVTTEPTNEHAWLDLLRESLIDVPPDTKNATKARAEITTAILGRALTLSPRALILRREYVKAGEEIWHESRVRAEWEAALKVGGPDMWMEWLEWRIGQAKDALAGIVEDAGRVLANTGDDMLRVRVLWRMAELLKSAGYIERANALFQAQAEWITHLPPTMRDLPFIQQLDELEEFWESEVPRIGEPNASGWAAWVASGKPTPTNLPTASTSSRLPRPPTVDPYTKWAQAEKLADTYACLPTRSFDESEDADPYSTIMFSDIRPLLSPIRDEAAVDAFRKAWLSVLGLWVPGNRAKGEWDDRWACAHLGRASYVKRIFQHYTKQTNVSADAVAGVLIGRELAYGDVFGPVKSWGGRDVVRALEVNVRREKGKERAMLWRAEDVEDVREEVVRTVFAQMRRLIEGDEEWDALALSFEYANGLHSATKLSRTFLSTARDSLPHWCMHAQLERLRGRLDDARKVYNTVLVASRPANTEPGAAQLWCDWAEMEWLDGKTDEALNVIMKATNVEGQGGIAILRARRNLEEAIKTTPSPDRWKDREAWVKMLALFELLSAKALPPALAVFDAHAPASGLARESMAIAALMVIYRHSIVLRTPTPPAILRERARAALDEFPSNSVVLAMVLEAEKGQAIAGHLRDIRGEGHQAKDVTRRVMDVWVGGWNGRWQLEAERTRTGLAMAVERSRTKGCAMLWRLFIELELRSGDFQSAKRLLYRAVRECPFAKELYMMAFDALRPAYNARELAELGDLMAERDIRMRRGLDEIEVGGAEESSSSDSESDGGDCELEQQAREYRRLMPY
ncbi:NRDE-2, necessary for RNA interference-domain-containing protein [Schizophyllum commune]